MNRAAPQIRVLLVDDDVVFRTVAAQSLRRLGCFVVVAATAADALPLAERAGPFDLLMADVVLPAQTGPQLVREFLQRWPQTRVLYTSSHDRAALERQGARLDTHDFLEKPFSEQALRAAVQRLPPAAAGT